MNRSTLKYFLIAWFCWAVSAQVWAATSAEILFQQATVKESGEREPEEAIKLYQQVVEQAGNDYQLKFKARFRMAACYEHLGESKEAEQTYLEVIGESASTSSEVVQEALASLRRLQAHEKAVVETSSATVIPQKPLVLRSQYIESRFSFTGGPSLLSRGAESKDRASASVRWRLLPNKAPLSLSLEAGSLIPGGNSQVAEQTKVEDSQTLDYGAAHLQYQIYLALISELPHGRERWVIPEGGVGVAFTSVRIETDQFLTNGLGGFAPPDNTTIRRSFSPYFSAGLHFLPDHLFSFIFQGSYLACPMPESAHVASEGFYGPTGYTQTTAHDQTFNFPSSYWLLSLKVQVKFGKSKLVLE